MQLPPVKNFKNSNNCTAIFKQLTYLVMNNHWKPFNAFNFKDILYIIWCFQWFDGTLTSNCAALNIRPVSEIWDKKRYMNYFMIICSITNWYRTFSSTSFALSPTVFTFLLHCWGALSLSIWHSYEYPCPVSESLPLLRCWLMECCEKMSTSGLRVRCEYFITCFVLYTFSGHVSASG